MRLQSLRLVNVGPHADTPLPVADLHAAVITGDNGGGKSMLLDGLLWGLWGKCRTPDPDRIIRSGTTRMEVVTEFHGRNGALYRATRVRRVDLAQPKTDLTLARRDGAEWTTVADGVREAQPAIIEACGLTYELALSTIIAAQGDSGRLLSATSGERVAVLERIIGVERFRTYAEVDGKAADAAEVEAQGIARAQDELRPLADALPVRTEELAAARHAMLQAERAAHDAEEDERAARAVLDALQETIRAQDARRHERATLAGAVQTATREAEASEQAAREAASALDALPLPDPTATPDALATARAALAAAEERLAEARAAAEEARRLAEDAERARRAAQDAQDALVALDEQIADAAARLAELPAVDPLATPEAANAAAAALETARAAHREASAAARAADEAARPLQQAQADAEALVRETFGAAKAEAHAATERAWQTHRAALAAAAAHERTAGAEQRRLDADNRAATEAVQRANRAQEAAAGTPFGDECGTRGCRFVADAFQLAEQLPALEQAALDATTEAEAHRATADEEHRRLTGAVTDAQRAADAATLAENALARGEDAPQAVLDAVEARQAARDAYAAAADACQAAERAEDAARAAAEAASAQVDAVSAAREAARADGERRAALAGRLETLRAGRPAAEERRAAADEADRAAAAASLALPPAAAEAERQGAAAARAGAAAEVARLERALDATRETGERRAALQAERETAQKAGRRARTRAALAEQDVAAFREEHAALLGRDLGAEGGAVRERLGAAARVAREAVSAAATSRAAEQTATAAAEAANRAGLRLDELAREADRHWTIAADFRRLQRAHRDVPTLMIEVILPAIEDEANALLAKVSQTGLGVRFDTQRDAKSRAGKIEVLDVWVRDRMGERLYETYSGGERFRLDWAVRIATAYVLAARYGVPLDMFWLDEGFGALDDAGRAAFAETLAATADLFDLTLCVTHLPELADCFSTQIHVEWTAAGSRVRILDVTGREQLAA